MACLLLVTLAAHSLGEGSASAADEDSALERDARCSQPVIARSDSVEAGDLEVTLDPFSPFLATEEGEEDPVADAKCEAQGVSKEEGGRGSELQSMAVYELTLNAIIKNGERTVALVQSSGGRGFLVREGTGIRGGFVKEIVSEDRETPLGVASIRKVVVVQDRAIHEGGPENTAIEWSLPSAGAGR